MKLNIPSLVRSVVQSSVMSLVVATAFSFAVNAQVQTQTPMQEAATLGSGKGQEVFSNVTSKLPDASTVPGYNGTDQQQKQYFQGGKGELVGPGVSRAGGCTQATDTECQAVNLIQWGPNNRPAPTFSANDPLLVGARQKMSNAKTTLGTFGTSAGTTAGLLTQTVTQCETKTVVTPAAYETSVCDETAQLENKTCNVDQTVKVDAQYDYLCEKTIERKTTQTCNKTLDVTCSGATPLQTCPDGAPLVNGRCQATVESQDQASISSYTCPAGYTVSGSSCVKTETASASIASYTCPTGSTVSGSSCITSTTTTQVGSPVYSCPAGSTVSGSSCLTTESISPNTNNTCPSGYTLNLNSCQRTVTSAATVASYTCPANYTLSGSTCSLTTSSTSSATPVYTCSAGYTLSGSTCSRQLSQSGMPVYTCPGGQTLSGSSCSQTTAISASGAYVCPSAGSIGARRVDGPVWGWVGAYSCTLWYWSAGERAAGCSVAASQGFGTWYAASGYCYAYAAIRYSCPSGYNLSGTTCLQTTTIAATISGYTCPAGYTVSGSSCVKTETASASIASYTCPTGSTVSGSSCITSTTTTQVGSPVYSCPAGSTVSGSSCLTTESISPNTNNTCPSGYTLNLNSCQRTVTSAATVASYTCPANYTLSGSTCSLTTSSTSSATPIYTCSAGYTLSGSTCSRQLTEAGTPQYSCRPGGTLIGTMCKYLLTTDTNPDVSYTCPVSGVLTETSAVNGTTTYSCCVDSFQNACQGLEAKVQ